MNARLVLRSPFQRPVGAWIIGSATALTFLYVAFREIDMPSMLGHLRSVRWPWVSAALLLVAASVWAKAERWRFLWGGEPPARSRLVSGILAAQAVNALVPLRVGDVSRAYFIRRHAGAGWALTTVALERVVDGLIVLGMAAATLAYAPTVVRFPGALGMVLAVLAVAVLLIVSVASLRRWLLRVLDRRERFLRNLRLALSERLPRFRNWRTVGGLVLWSACVWLIQVGFVLATLKAVRLESSVAVACAVLAAQYLGSPVPSVARMGTHQAFSIWVLTAFGAAPEIAAAFSVLFYIVSVAFPIAAGCLTSLFEVKREMQARSSSTTEQATDGRRAPSLPTAHVDLMK